MKKIIILFALSVIMISCNKESENQFTITGSAVGIEDGKNVFLELCNFFFKNLLILSW